MEIIEVHTRRDWNLFFIVPQNIFKNDPYWVAPLQRELRRTLDRKKNPYFSHCYYRAWIILEGKVPIGRIIAYVDTLYNKLYSEKSGFFGFFDCINDQTVVNALFSTVSSWFQSEGLIHIYGPINFSIANECGVLLSGFDSSPVIQMNHTPPYYAELLENAEFEKAHDLYAYLMTKELMSKNRDILIRMQRIKERTLQKSGVKIRPVNMKNYSAELGNINVLFNDFMQDTWGFVPSSFEEMSYVGETLKLIVDPQIIFIVEVKDKVVGCSLSVPDFNEVLKHFKGTLSPIGLLKMFWYKSKLKSFRLLMLGVSKEYRKMGIDTLLYYYTIIKGLERGYTKAELSWISEDNSVLISIVEKIGAIRYKTYRVYHKSI